MTEASPNIEEMKRYLFREMSEEESATVEDKIFSDTDFYYELTELENDLVDDYARGQLTGTDLERFERSLKFLPKRREKAANAIALQSVIAEGKIVRTEQVGQGFWEKITTFFSLKFSAMQLAAGALAILIMCVGGFLIYKNRQAQNEFAEIERQRESERIDKENRLRQLEEQKRLEEQRRIENDNGNQLPINGDTQDNSNSQNENKNIDSEIDKLKKDIDDLKKNNPSRKRNEIQPSTPYLAVSILPIGRGGDAGDAPKAKLETVNGKQIIRITKNLPTDKDYGSYQILSNGEVIDSKTITQGAKSIVFSLPPEIKDFEIKAAERTATRGDSDSLGTYELKLTKNNK